MSNELLALEKKKPVETVLIVEKLCENQLLKLFNKKLSWKKIIRVVAYILRFVRNCKVKNGHAKKLNGEIRALDANEFEASFLKIVEIIQSEEFAGEITELEKGKVLKNNRIQKLNPFIQKITFNGFNLQLLRVGGRLGKSELAYEVKHPLLLTKSSNFVRSYFRNLHLSNCYAATKLIVPMSREKIWVVNARELARQIVRKCIPCFRF